MDYGAQKWLTEDFYLHRGHVDSRMGFDVWMLNFNSDDRSTVTCSCTMNLGQRRRRNWTLFKTSKQLINSVSQVSRNDAFNVGDRRLWRVLMQNLHGVDVLGRQQVIKSANMLANFDEAAAITTTHLTQPLG